jgi:hypothetical protein
MGSKSHSKKIMDDSGVPTTPGYHGDDQSAEYLFHEAVTNVGFPLLIKVKEIDKNGCCYNKMCYFIFLVHDFYSYFCE